MFSVFVLICFCAELRLAVRISSSRILYMVLVGFLLSFSKLNVVIGPLLAKIFLCVGTEADTARF